MLQKTIGYYIEHYGGRITALAISFSIGFFNTDFINFEAIIESTTNFGLALFGFLLTLLGIILQGNSPMIIEMKERKTIFKRLIQFNKRVVFLSIIIWLYSCIILSVNLDFSLDNYIDCKILLDFPNKFFWISNLYKSIFVFLFVWLIYDVFLFLRLFYLIVLASI